MTRDVEMGMRNNLTKETWTRKLKEGMVPKGGLTNGLGSALAQKGRWPEAVEAFQKAISIERVIAVPTIGLGRGTQCPETRTKL